MKKVYLAGPQVFLPDAEKWYSDAKALCLENGLEALTPFNNKLHTARDIFRYNREQILSAHYIIADVNPFRGTEPDSGTVWEIGFAYARGKYIIAHQNSVKTVRDKTLEFFDLDDGDIREIMPDGMAVEDLGGYVNLMIGMAGQMVAGDFASAVTVAGIHARIDKRAEDALTTTLNSPCGGVFITPSYGSGGGF